MTKKRRSDLFDEQLQAEVEITPRHDMLVVMGDLNSKVGNNNTGNERVMGKHGCGFMNENGAKLLEFCNNNNLVVRGTLFPHRDIHKLTWYSPNNRDRNQIDHLLINRTWRRSLMDVKVRRGADASSDHHLIVALIQLKLRNTINKIQKAKHFNINYKTAKPNAFTIQVTNRFQALQAAEANNNEVDTLYSKIVSAYMKSCEVCLDPKIKSEAKECNQIHGRQSMPDVL